MYRLEIIRQDLGFGLISPEAGMRFDMSDISSAGVVRKVGKVTRVLGDYGFVSADDAPDHDIYFKTSWFRGSPSLTVGEAVVFDIKSYGDKQTANHILRYPETPVASDSEMRRVGRSPISGHLFDWAYLGYVPNVLAELRGLALEERWEFKNAPRDVDRPLPILHGYLIHTFRRLVLEGKVIVNERASLAAFNTGLVDRRYETIYALFAAKDDPRQPWQLAGFCIAGEGADGQNLVRHFNPLPPPAHYFDTPTDLLYDTRAGKPELDWNHIVIDNIRRYPTEFIEDHWPAGCSVEVAPEGSGDQNDVYYTELARAIEADNRTYRRIMNRMKDAVDLSIKRVSWNFKTAIPQYYPRVRKLQLLLPVCLVSDEQVDLALAVEKTDSGSYLGHTVLPLDWAYRNARLICRPDSDWLAPEEIIDKGDEEQEA